ncbi:heparinase II/III domain-containing protein [Sinomicrobium soli]|uniref:heparinase II/III domain-containing protein n=1 Tax=Sinomicrobium sp. N-1-3-6 TaxID=2219864 RepID=UPI0013751ECA|nr:heparinase II/III family protein [Sinomicrobium sp. N-1-3-6]
MNYITGVRHRKRDHILWICLLFIFWNTWAAMPYTRGGTLAAPVPPHPRLLLGDAEIPGMKTSVQNSDALAKMHRYILEKSTAMLGQAPVTYKKEGKRLLAVSRLALTRIFFLSYAYRMTGDTGYLQRAEKELLAVSAFDDWNPSHFLDVGEMCMGAAIGYDWLYNDLSESTRHRIREAIVKNGLDAASDPGNAWFYKRDNNWNQVCNAGLVMGALAVMEDEPDKAAAVIDKAVKSNVLPLEGYGKDGNYPEGPGYWNYGTSFQVLMLEALENVLGTDYGLSAHQGFMNSAQYMLFSTGPSGQYFNYSDCISKPYPAYAMFWFARKMNSPELVYQEMQLIRSGRYFTYRHGNDDRLLPMALIFARGTEPHAADMGDFPVTWSGGGETPVFYTRTSWDDDRAKYLGVKGGKAFSSHGHMDQGSFVYDTGHLRWAMDFGSQQYETLEREGVDLWDMEQDGQRWEIFRMNNLNHNTLSINDQPHNVQGKATIIKSFDTGKQKGVTLDLTDVLNLHGELRKATRELRLVDQETLQVEDIVKTADNGVRIRWNMVTPARVRLTERGMILTQEGKEMMLVFESNIPLDLKVRPSEQPSETICPFTGRPYGDYNQPNPGTTMLGFDAFIPSGTRARFVVSMSEGNNIDKP